MVTNTINTVTVGMIKGRHPLPVSEYIFAEGVKDPMDFKTIEDGIYKFIEEKVGICTTTGLGLNQFFGCDETILVGEKPLVVYVTGLTPVTAALIRLCALYGVSLTLMHYNNATEDYKAQKIF